MVRPTQQTSTKRKRKSNDLIWARDGDHKNAQEHPAYILENCNEEDTSKNDNDEVWVEWSSNGTVACIPKSRISTAGLSSRRRRHNNNGRKQPGDNNDSEPISNDTFANDNLPSVSDSKAKKESIQVKREDVKVKEERYGGETDNDDNEEEDTVPTPVVSLYPKKEEYEEDTDDDIALDQVQSTHVNKVKEELEESTDDEGVVAPDLVLSNRVKVKTEDGEDT